MLPDETFGGRADRCKAELLAISSGAFRELAEALRMPETLESVVGDCYFKLISQWNYRDIIQQWTRSFIDRKTKHRAKRRDWLLSELRDDEIDYQQSPWTGSIYERFINISKQKRGIVEQLEKGNDSRARSFIEQLIAFQIRGGNSASQQNPYVLWPRKLSAWGIQGSSWNG